jgi:hypothetical protein
LVILIVSGVGVSPVAAQENGTETEIDDTPEDLLYQFENGLEIRDIQYENGSANVELVGPDRPVSVSVGEGALEESGGFNYQSVRLRPGEDRIVSLPVRDEAVVITSGDDGYYHEGDTGVTIVTRTPTTEMLQIVGLSGVGGSIVALGIVIGQLKRRHSNSYKEIFSEEWKKIEKDPVEGYYERFLQILKDTAGSRYRLAGLGLIGIYFVLVLLGFIPGPGQMWGDLSDYHRLIVAGIISATIVAITPIYWLVKKIWDPD